MCADRVSGDDCGIHSSTVLVVMPDVVVILCFVLLYLHEVEAFSHPQTNFFFFFSKRSISSKMVQSTYKMERE